MRYFLSLVVVVTVALGLTGCASFDKLMASLDGETNVPPLKDIYKAPRYSENENLAVPTDRIELVGFGAGRDGLNQPEGCSPR